MIAWEGVSVKQESDPVSEGEWLVRRVHRDQFRAGKDPYISPKAFRPQVKGYNPGKDGISLFRLSCLESASDVLQMIPNEQKRLAVGLVAIRVSEAVNLGLTINRTPIDEIPGHVSIPEMDVEAMTNPEKQTKLYERMDKLAESRASLTELFATLRLRATIDASA